MWMCPSEGEYRSTLQKRRMCTLKDANPELRHSPIFSFFFFFPLLLWFFQKLFSLLKWENTRNRCRCPTCMKKHLSEMKSASFAHLTNHFISCVFVFLSLLNSINDHFLTILLLASFPFYETNLEILTAGWLKAQKNVFNSVMATVWIKRNWENSGLLSLKVTTSDAQRLCCVLRHTWTLGPEPEFYLLPVLRTTSQ